MVSGELIPLNPPPGEGLNKIQIAMFPSKNIVI